MRGRVSGFIKKHLLTWHVVTVLLYVAAILAVVFLFPDVSNLWVSIFVLVSSFTSSVSALAAALLSADPT